MTLRLSNPGSTRINDTATGRSTTRTHLSTNINILVDGIAVGAISKMQISEKRSVKKTGEVGTDGFIDSSPTTSTDISGSCDRTRFDGQRIAEAFLRGYVHVAAQRLPFDIEIQDNFKGGDAGSIVITTIRNVWITGIDYTYQSDNFVIVDSMNWTAESIESVMGSGASVVGPVNNRGITIAQNAFEVQADTGIFRGALDAAGLLDAFDGSNL
jgi:hypothetical protein